MSRPEWIPVDQSLPNHDHPVLVAFPDGSGRGTYSTAMGCLWYGEWRVDGCGKVNVTHWMEKPEPPTTFLTS